MNKLIMYHVHHTSKEIEGKMATNVPIAIAILSVPKIISNVYIKHIHNCPLKVTNQIK